MIDRKVNSTSSCSSFVKATKNGKTFPPTEVRSALGMMVGRRLMTDAAAVLLVSSSIPIIFGKDYTPRTVNVITCCNYEMNSKTFWEENLVTVPLRLARSPLKP